MGHESYGEDFSLPLIETKRDKPLRRGRPSAIDPETLKRSVNELQFVLEQNWRRRLAFVASQRLFPMCGPHSAQS